MYKQRFDSFGWNTIVIDGHDILQIVDALSKSRTNQKKPLVIIANTLKGKNMGITVEDSDNYHGKPLADQAQSAIDNLQSMIKNMNVKLELNGVEKDESKNDFRVNKIQEQKKSILYNDENNNNNSKNIATREVYGHALKELGKDTHDINKQIVVLDADVKNSTFSIEFMKAHPDRFIECFIAEQNMVSVGLGLQARGKIVYLSTFAAFLSRAYDQIRMGGVSSSNLKICGSHAGCAIGEDGTSQMGLEDIAMMRAIPDSVVLYPSDKYSMEMAVYLASRHKGLTYIRSTRGAYPHLHSPSTLFSIGKSILLKTHSNDSALIIAAGVTIQEAINANHILNQQHQIYVRILDIFSIKPIDQQAIIHHAQQAKNNIIVVEDHYQQGGIFEAVCSALSQNTNIRIFSLCVNRIPKSGKPQELLEFCGISQNHIVKKVLEVQKI